MHGCGKGLASSRTEFIFQLIYNIYRKENINFIFVLRQGIIRIVPFILIIIILY